MITFVGRKSAPIDFNGNVLDTLQASPEETRAIVRKDNGRFAIAHFSYVRFGGGEQWVIWTDCEYANQFKAMMALGLALPNARGWGISDQVKYVRN